VLRAIFGEVRWSPPRWVRFGAHQTNRLAAALARARQRNPLRFWTISAAVVILIVGGSAALNWYRHRPPPRYLEVTVTWPKPTELKPGAKPDLLSVSFSGSAASLGMVGKQVSSGITVTPALEGVWNGRPTRT
jgi:hypothetical protein